jgi:hypothetical protein
MTSLLLSPEPPLNTIDLATDARSTQQPMPFRF